ncbi:hypothetical protein AB0I54_45865, partial [Streptomyces sp. NPDC050625]
NGSSFGPRRGTDAPAAEVTQLLTINYWRRTLVAVPEPVRITPTDLVRLRVESGLALGEIRAEVQRAEIPWRQHLSRWYGDGRLAAEASAPDISLLQRVLDGLRNPRPAST